MAEPLEIGPSTRVATLLDRYPQLEEVLVAQSPAFERLRNPVLRRTIARLATLEQAAGIAGIPVDELVAVLRRAAAGETVGAAEPAATGAAPAAGAPEAPSWLDPARVVETIDADALLDAGEVPVGPVLARARRLAPGEILRVTASFAPTPLLDRLAGGSFATHLAAEPPGHALYVRREP